MAKIRRYDEIMESAMANMIARQDKITDFNEGSIIHTILDTVARLTERAYVAIRQGYNEMLAILPYSPFGFEKKQGIFASGTVIFSRENPLTGKTIIPKGVVVSGSGLKFTTIEHGNIQAGVLNSEPVRVIAEKSGTDYNIEPGVIDTIDSIVPVDIVAVTNENAFSGGTNEESEAEFSARFKTYINGLSGTNSYAIKNAALQVNAVRNVSVVNHKPPLQNIYNMTVYVDDGSGGASEDNLAAVKLAIEGDGTAKNQGHLAPGVTVRVIAPTVIYADITLKVKIAATDIDEAKVGIIDVIKGYVNNLSIGESCTISTLTTKVMELNYVKDVTFLSPKVNIESGKSQIVRLRTLTVNLSGE